MVFTSRNILSSVTLLGAILLSPGAFAHAHLTQQSPAADAAISTSPQILTLDFSEGIEPGFSGVTLTGPQKTVIKTGAVKRNEKDDKQLVVPVEEPLKPGAYSVDWHVVSVDGHKTKGQYRFSVK